MTKKDYKRIADIIKDIKSGELPLFAEDVKEFLAKKFVCLFAEDNPRFNEKKFREACGIK